MKQSSCSTSFWLTLGTLVVVGLSLTASASAQHVIVLTHYQEIPGKEAQLSQVIDTAVSPKLAGVKGLQWIKFFYNPSTGERGAVSLWESQADWEAYLKSDVRKELLEKVQPLIQGEASGKVYPVYEPKK
jgi:heme-degrading monooxygenase HmoA